MKQKNFLVLFFLFLGATVFAQLSENFNTGLAGSYTTGSQTLASGDWQTVAVFKESSTNSRGGSGAAARINDDVANASLTTPSLNGAGTVTFWYRELSSGAGTFELQKSTDGTSYTTIASQAYSGQTYVKFSFDVNDASANLTLRILSDDNPGHLIIDDFEVTAFGGAASPTVTFDVASSSVNETDADVVTAGIPVTLTNYNADVTITPTINGASTAESGDYVLDLTPLTFTSNQTLNIPLTIKDDADFDDETIIIDFTVTSGTADLGTSTHTVTITDDEMAPLPTETVPYSEDFSDCGAQNWTVATVGAELEWTCGSGYFEANAFGSSGAADDYLISPSFNMDAQSDEILSFNSWTRFADATSPQIELLYTTNYTGDPSTTVWVNTLSPTWPAPNSQTTTSSGNLDVSSVTGTAVHFAFRYTSTGTSGGSTELWRIEDFEITTASTPSITLSENSLTDLNYEEGSGPSVEQTFTAEGSNLTADIIVTAPTNFEISTTSGASFGSSVTLTQTGGTVATTTIYVRLASGLTVNSYSGTLSATSASAIQQDVSLSGNVTAPSCAGTSTTFPYNGVSGSTNLEHSSSNPPGASGEDCGTNYLIYYVSSPSTDSSGNYLRSNTTDDLIESADWGGEGRFETFAIDVSGETSIDVNTFGSTVSNPFTTANEKFQWWYKLDGGAETNLGSVFGQGYDGSLAVGPTTIDVTGVNEIVVGFTFEINGGGDGFEDVNVTVNTTPATIIWEGDDSTLPNDWTQGENWSGGSVPTMNDNVVIPGGLNNYPVLSSSETVNSATIESGAYLKIEGIGSLNGEVIYKRALTANWHLIASPVEGELITDFMTNHTLVTGSGTSPSQNVGLATYQNSQADPMMRWSYYVDGYTGGDMFDVAKGFTTKLASAGEITFKGTARSGDQPSDNLVMSAPTGTDFNLLGNPFLAAINSKTLAEDTDNGAIDNNTFWLWDGNMYQPYNDGSTIDIAPGQGFFVKAASTDPVSFKAMNQLSSDGNFQKENKASITLMLAEGTNKRTTKILYINGKTTGADYGYDSEIFSEGNFALYTQLLSNDEGKKLGIQTLPNENYEDMIVPLGVKASGGKEIEVSADIQNLPSNVNVYLEDRVNGTFTNLSEENFKITLNEDTNGIGQFYLHTTSKSLSNDVIAQSLENVSVYTSGKSSLTIAGLQTEKATVNVFSVVGKKVFSTTISSNGVKNVDLPQLSSGVYIVNVNTELGKVSKKIVLE